MPSTVTQRIQGLTTSVAVKAPCVVATTANITLSGTQTIDGVAVVADNRVLVKDQTTASENGIYLCKSTSWERARDFDGDLDGVKGTLIPVLSGTINAPAGTRFFEVTTSDGFDIGTDSIAFQTADVSVGSGFPFGVKWDFDSSTSMADPGTGDIRLNHATLASVTAIAVSATDGNGVDISDYVTTWDDSTTTAVRGVLVIRKMTAPQNYAVFNVTSAVTDNSTWLQMTVAYVTGSGSFSATNELAVQFFRTGNVGQLGGGFAVGYTFSTTTTDSDPGAGVVRLNNATQSSATAVYIDNVDADSGASMTALLDSIDDSTNTVKGHLSLRAPGDAGKYLIFSVSGSVTDGTGYRKVTISNVAASGSAPFAAGDAVILAFARSGDVGTTGATGATGGAAGLPALFDSSTSMADPGAGDIRFNHATVSSVTALAVSATLGGNDVSDFIATWDDSTTTAARGSLVIKEWDSTPSVVSTAIFTVSGAITDNGAWLQIPVTYVSNTGTISNTNALTLEFSRTGNTGSGDMTAANNLSDVASKATSATNLGLGGVGNLLNFALAASVGSNNLTIAIKGTDGNDPSASNPVVIGFRDATATSGDYTPITLTAATSIVIADTTTLGTANSQAFRIWVVGFNDGGTFRLGVVNCLVGGATPTQVFALNEAGVASSTANTTASDSAAVFYTDSAVTSKAYRILGYCDYGSGLATAGTYASAPTTVQIFGPGVKKPGDRVQLAVSTTGTETSTTSSTFQSTNVAAAIALSSAANIVVGLVNGSLYSGNAATNAVAGIYRDSTYLAAAVAVNPATQIGAAILFRDKPNSTSSVTYTTKLKSSDNTNTVKFPVTSGGIGESGGAAGVYGAIQLEEIMA